jgi:glucose/arabinose dehydrogenase
MGERVRKGARGRMRRIGHRVWRGSEAGGSRVGRRQARRRAVRTGWLGWAVVLGWAAWAAPAGAVGACAAGRLTGAEAVASDWRADRPGLCRRILAADLPPPGPSDVSRANVIARQEGAAPALPPGFTATLFYRDPEEPRAIRAAPGGDLFVAESEAGQIRVLRPGPDGRLARNSVFARGLHLPFGIAFWPQGAAPRYVYVAENDRVVRFAYAPGDMVARGPAETVVASLPQGAGHLPGGGHWTRDVAFSADGRTMYVSVGSFSNVAEGGVDETGRADILAFAPDGSGRRVFASGIRNPVGLAVSPVDGRLWASVNERDELGDRLVPDYVTAVGEGQFFGWPWFYIGAHRDPRHAADAPARHPPVTVPSVLLPAHSASLCAAFAPPGVWPAPFAGSLFVAEHGSWNRGEPTGSKIVRVAFDAQGRASDTVEDFATGFTVSNHDVWARPVGITFGSDGALYMAEDANDTVWRIDRAR